MPNIMTFALAETGAAGMLTDSMKTAITTALNGISASVFEVMEVALPIGLGITGVFLAIRLGINFFRGIAN